MIILIIIIIGIIMGICLLKLLARDLLRNCICGLKKMLELFKMGFLGVSIY
jgi:hypothetical protein